MRCARDRAISLKMRGWGELPEKLKKLDPYPALLRVTYMAGSAVPSDVLADGRILFEAAFPLGAFPQRSRGAGQPVAEMYLVYQDGSGVESYRCDHGRSRWGGKQLGDGDVVFTHGAGLARFTSPMAHEVAIAAPRAEYAGGIAELAGGEWLVSARTGAGTHYALKMWKPGAAALGASAGGERQGSGGAGGGGARGRSRTGILRRCTRGAMPTCWRWTRGCRARGT